MRAGACSHQTLGSPILRAVLAFPHFDKRLNRGLQTCLMFPVRCEFMNANLPRCAVIRPTNPKGIPVGVANFLFRFSGVAQKMPIAEKIGGRFCTELVGLWSGIDPSLPRGASAVARRPPKAHKHWSFRIFCLEAKMVPGYTQAVPVDPETLSRDPDTLQKV